MNSFKTRDESALWMDVVIALCKSSPDSTSDYIMRRADEFVTGFQGRNEELLGKIEDLLTKIKESQALSDAGLDLPPLKGGARNN